MARGLRFIHCRDQIAGVLLLWYSFDMILGAIIDVLDINDCEYGNDYDREHERPPNYGLQRLFEIWSVLSVSQCDEKQLH